ncbi:MAG: Ig-like domain-containing protein [Thiobacillaceae bacterium]
MPHTPFRLRPLVEELEPRILFSADLAPIVLDGLQPAPEQRVLTIDGEFSNTATAAHHELVIVDTGVQDYQSLLADILKQRSDTRHIDVVVLDPAQDALSQITQALQSHGQLDALHIISHGESGELLLGNTLVNDRTLETQAASIQSWSNALSAHADILLYGCDVAEGAAGQQFVNSLARLTGADVAANTDLTGSAALGGDWTLETHTGSIETAILLGSVQTAWQGTLNINADSTQQLANIATPNDQSTTPSSRQVAINPVDGSFVVMWTSANQDGNGTGVYLRRFDAAGNALTGEIQVNTYTSNNQQNPAIAMDANGKFVVVWESQNQDGNKYGIYAKRFNADGSTATSGVTGEFLVNNTTSGDQTSPSIGMDAAGNFVVAWQSNDSNGLGIYARRFNAAGTALGTEFQVNNTTTNDQYQPAVAMNASGEFVIVWASVDQDSNLLGGKSTGVYARLFNPDGSTLKNEFTVHPLLLLDANDQYSPDVAMNDAGLFAVVAVDDSGSSQNIAYRLFNSSGGAITGGDYATDAAGINTNPAVAIGNGGDFIVAWENIGMDGAGSGIVARHIGADGSKLGGEHIVNIVTASDQVGPSLARSGNHAVFVWSGKGTEDSNGVYFLQADINTPPVITSNGGGASASVSVAEGTTAITMVTATDSDVPAQTLSYSLIGGTDLSAFSINPGTGALVFNAARNYETPGDANGDNIYQVIVQVDDGHGGIDTQTINVTLTNAPPVAQNDSYTTSANATLTVSTGTGLLANDADPAGGALSVYTITQPSNGTVSLVPSPITSFTNINNNSAVDAHGDWSPDGSKIAFTSNRDGDYEIFVMNANGTNVVPLTSNTSIQDNQPAWSPNGNQIAYMSDTSNGLEVWVMDSNGGNKHQIAMTTNATDISGQPTWSPDGTKIAFTSTRSGSSGYDIWVANADGTGSPVKLFTASGTDAEPVWSPDGSKIAFSNTNTTTGVANVFVMDANGTNLKQLTFNSGSGVDKSPVWSPDGSMIAFVSDRTSTSQLYIMDADGSHQTKITNAASAVTFPDWAPNSNKVLFTVGNDIQTATLVFDGSFIYTPNAGFSGTDSFTYQVTDASGSGSTATVTLTVTPANTPPGVSPVTLSAIAEDSGAHLVTQAALLAGATDANGDSLTAINLANTSGNGTLTDNGNGTWTYTPTLNDDTSVSFSFTVSDGHGGSVANTASLDLTPVNDAPVAVNDNATGNEDTSITGTVLSNDTDVEGNALTANLVAGPANGSLILNANGSFTYTPAANFNGTDSFTYKANDGTSDSTTATVTITVNSVNDAPAGSNKTITFNEDTAYTLKLADFGLTDPNDVSANSLASVKITSLPAAGSLLLYGNSVAVGQAIAASDLSNGGLKFVPAANANGNTYANFTFQVKDDGGTANGGVNLDPTPNTLTFNVTPVNDAPTASNANIDVPVNLLYSGTLPAAVDVDGDTITYSLVSQGSHGLASVSSDGTYTYLPLLSYNGSDSFTFNVSDGGGNNTYTITINVGSINTAPVATADSATGDEDTTLSGNVLANDSDVDGNPLTATLVSGPANGSLTFGTDGSFIYAPVANWNGTDSFTYKANDGALDSSVVSVTLAVVAINDDPTASDDSIDAIEDTGYVGSLPTWTDIDSANVAYELNTQATNGTAAINGDGSFTYNPNANFNGSDSFSYTINDGNGGTNTYTVTVGVAPVNDAPTTSPVTLASIAENSGARLITQAELLSNAADVDSPSLTATSLALTAGAGTLTNNGNGTWTYTPALNDDTAVSFSYTVTDGSKTTDGSASMDIAPVNNAPTASAYSFSSWEDTTHTDTLPTASDVEGDTISYSLSTPAGHGTVSIATDGSFTYTSTGNYFGSDSFTYTVSDGVGGSNSYAVSVSISPVNDAPTSADNTVTTSENSTYVFQMSDFPFSDPGDSGADNLLTVSIVTLPSSGTLFYEGIAVTAGQIIDASGIALGELEFVPVTSANGAGYASFTFQVQDSGGIIDGGVDIDPAVHTLTIDVTPVNDAPVAGNDSATGNEDTSISGNVLGNDSDMDSATLVATLVSGPANGSLTLGLDGSFTYTPNANFNGTDSFTYVANDGTLDSNVATVTLTVSPVNDAPTASDTSISATEDVTYSGNLPAATDVDIDTISYGLSSPAANGTVSVNPDGSFSYAPSANFNGTDSFVYSVNDGKSGRNTYTVSVNVAAVNDMPALTTTPLSLNQGETVVLTSASLQASDVDNTAAQLTFTITSVPAAGTLVLNGTPLVVSGSFTQDDINNGRVTYTHTAAIAGSDSVGVTVSDPASAQASGVMTFTVITPSEAAAPAMPTDPATQPKVAPDEPAPAVEETAAATTDPTLAGPQDSVNIPVTTDSDENTVIQPDSNVFPTLAAVRAAFNLDPSSAANAPAADLLSSLSNALQAIAHNAQALQSLQTSLGSSHFQQQLDQLKNDIHEQLRLDKNTVASTLVVSTGLSVGYVLWLVRGGVLLSSLLSSLPAWRLIDPLPILGNLARKTDDDDDESLEGMLKKSAATPTPPTHDERAP